MNFNWSEFSDVFMREHLLWGIPHIPLLLRMSRADQLLLFVNLCEALHQHFEGLALDYRNKCPVHSNRAR